MAEEERSNIAKKLYLEKKYKEALKEYSELINLYPLSKANYYANRAECYLILGLYQLSLNDEKKCIELNPNDFKAYQRSIKCCLILGEIFQADTLLSELIELDPNNEDIPKMIKQIQYQKRYIKHANTAYDAKDYRKVVYCMDCVLTVSTAAIRFKLTKAECLTFLGRYQEAQEIVKILHLDNKNVDAIYIRGMCLYFQDEIARAHLHFQHIFRLVPEHTKALEIYKRIKNLISLKERGYMCTLLNEYSAAIKHYTNALAIDPLNKITNSRLHFKKAEVAVKLGQYDESIAEYTEALKLDKKYVDALHKRGIIYVELKEYEKAIHDFEKAYKLKTSLDIKRLLIEAKLALRNSKRKNYYTILGINKDASFNDIKKAYWKQAMAHHPDRHPNATEEKKKEQERKFKEVGEAYGILSDPGKRYYYDNRYNNNIDDFRFTTLIDDFRFTTLIDDF